MSFESTTSSALPEGETRTNLIINYLPQTLTDQEFYKIFVVVGPIKNCRIMKDLKVYVLANVSFFLVVYLNTAMCVALHKYVISMFHR